MTALRLARRLAPRADWHRAMGGRLAILQAGPFHLRCYVGDGKDAGRWSVRILWEPLKPATVILWSSSRTEKRHGDPEEALMAALGWLRSIRAGLEKV